MLVLEIALGIVLGVGLCYGLFWLARNDREAIFRIVGPIFLLCVFFILKLCLGTQLLSYVLITLLDIGIVYLVWKYWKDIPNIVKNNFFAGTQKTKTLLGKVLSFIPELLSALLVLFMILFLLLWPITMVVLRLLLR